jgi:hypothetical protein
MRTLLIGLVVCLVLAVGAAFYFNWLTLSTGNPADNGQNQTRLKVNKDKIEHDYNAVKEGVKEGAEKVGEQVKKGSEAVAGEVKKDTQAVKEKTGPSPAKTAEGTVSAVDAQKSSLTVETTQKETVPVKVEAGTKIRVHDKDGTLTDLKAGQPVAVNYETKGAENVALTVTVKGQ